MTFFQQGQGHDAAGQHGLVGIHVVADKVEFQMGGLAQDLHGAARVGKTGQLHLDAVAFLLADVRLGHTELVDTVADGPQGLVQRHVFDAVDLFGTELGHIAQTGFRATGLAHIQLGKILLQDLLQFGFILHTGQGKFQFVIAHHAGMQHDDLLVLGKAADILPGQRQRVADSLGHVNAQGQVDTALQVQAKVDFFGW